MADSHITQARKSERPEVRVSRAPLVSQLSHAPAHSNAVVLHPYRTGPPPPLPPSPWPQRVWTGGMVVIAFEVGVILGCLGVLGGAVLAGLVAGLVMASTEGP